ncbi:MAG: insulysin [Halieaceae bacterium]|jgi:insulysin
MTSFLTTAKIRLCLLSLCLVLLACANQPQQSGPIKSPNDSDEYRYLTLDNGLRVMLVSDPDADKAAASLDVNVGSGDSPRSREGLPHFLEHMLFLGTEKYPDSSEYERYITEHGGFRNAYTSYAHTNYFFDIDHAYLEPALDRFAQFFTSPNFDEVYVDREKNAVDSEYQMGIKGDARRNLDVFREVFNPAHPMTKFSVGSLETLSDREGATIRGDLLDFYQRWYSANIMTLAVIGRESLDEMQAIVEAKFSAVPNQNTKLEQVKEPLFVDGTLPLEVAIEPEADVRQLQVFYPIPDYSKYYHSKPEAYLGSILGHEGQGSLLSVLKSDGLAESLGAGAGLSYRGGSLMSISIGLTQGGMEQRDVVISKLFQAIELLRREGPSKALYEEQGKLAAQAFRFRGESAPASNVRGIATAMQYYAPEDTLWGDYVMDDYRPDLLVDLVDHLQPERAFVVQIAKGVETDQQSNFYSTPYRTNPIGQDQLAKWINGATDPRLTMPAANEFIAEDLEQRLPYAGNGVLPIKVVERENLDIWFRQDDQFKVPKGGIYVNLRSPAAIGTPREAVLSELYMRLLGDAINEYVYPASLAGVNLSVAGHTRGFALSLGGYNDKQLMLLERVLAQVQARGFNAGRYHDLREKLERDYANSKKARPYSQLIDDSRELFQHHDWDELVMAATVADIELDQVMAYHDRFWAAVKAEVLMFGNYRQADIDKLAGLLNGMLPTEPIAELPKMRVLKLAAGQELVEKVAIDHQDSVVSLYYQGGANSWLERAQAALTAQVLQSDFFEEIRTEKQRGYIVFASALPMMRVPGVVFVVQSSSSGPAQLSADIAEFISGMAVEGRVTEEVFNRHRDALIMELNQSPKNIFDQAGRYWRDISRKQYDFNGIENMTAALQGIDLAAWDAHFRDSLIENPRSVLVYTSGRFDAPAEDEAVAGDRQPVTDYLQLKADSPWYEMP